jgi:hypothetical protein
MNLTIPERDLIIEALRESQDECLDGESMEIIYNLIRRLELL